MSFIAGIHLSIEQLINLQRESNHFKHRRHSPVRSALAGNYRSRFKGRGMDFDEVRHYQPGDDIRSIDWRVTARTQQVHTKLFSEERERPVFLMIDQSASMFFGSQNTLKAVIGAATASILLWSSLQRKDRIGGLLFDNDSHRELKPANSRKAALALLHQVVESHNRLVNQLQESLAEPAAPPTHSTPSSFNENLERLRNLAHPGSTLCIFSDCLQFDETSSRHLATLAKHNDVTIYQINDPLDEKLPPLGVYPITDGFQHALLDTRHAKSRAEFEAITEQRNQRLKDCATKHRIQHHRLSTSSGNTQRLFEFLKGHQSVIHRRSELFSS
ncbi:MAG: DUF58 domain-containing protein [Pseudomonadota bacterium]